jgi:hypothetical protein
MVDELLERGTDGGPPRYTGWLEALKAVYDAAGQKVHEADWVVDAGYIGRTIQLFKDRLRGHENKPQLTYTILEHCKKILRENPKRFVMPTCLRWVRRRPLPIRPGTTPLSPSAGSVQLHPRLGGHDRRARETVRPDRGPSCQRVRVLCAVRTHAPPTGRASVGPPPRRRMPHADALLRPLSVPGPTRGAAGCYTVAS